MTFPGFPQAPQQQGAPQAFGGFPQQPAPAYPQQQAPAGFGGYPQQPAPGFGGFPQQQASQQPYQPGDPNSFLMGGGIKAAQFPTVGATVTGTIEDLEVQQQRDLDTGQPMWWDDGSPREQLVITLVTAERDPANPLDDGRRRVYAKAQMLQAIRNACRAAGHPEGMAIGGRLAVQYVGDGEKKKNGYNAPKQYAAQYAGPDPSAAANSMLMTGPVEQPQPPAQQQQQLGQPGPWAETPAQQPYPVPQAAAAGGYVGPGAPGVAVNGGVNFGQLLGAPQQVPGTPPPVPYVPGTGQGTPPAPAGVAIPEHLPANVKAALEVLPPEQVAAALAQMGIAPQQAPAA